jgi:alkylation response protein AidB-like acyl-CoA dehydrogenase
VTNDVRLMLLDSARRLFSDHVDDRLVAAAQREGWSPSLWQALERAELPLVSIPEEAGGAGGTLSDAAVVLRVAGRHTAPVPLAETGMLAGWMLAASGLTVPRGALTVGPVLDGDHVMARRQGGGWQLSGALARVPWARIASRLVILAEGPAGPIVACVDPARCRITHGTNLAGEPRDDVALEGVPADTAAPAGREVNRDTLKLRGALTRSLLMAGALERALELAVDHAQQRVQFGRKIGQFQAIQQEVARLGGESAVAVAAALSAAGVVERGGDALLAVASAKIRAADAAREGALVAHQVHGAIGVTNEHALHHATLRLWAWREEFGNEAHWAMRLGLRTQRDGAPAFWPALTAG